MDKETRPINFSPDELNATLLNIDSEMRREGVLIRARQIEGWRRFCVKHKVGGIDWHHPLSKRVFEWFSAVYGDRLNIDFDYGKTGVEVRGDIYEMRCIRFWGTLHLFCDPQLLGVDLGPSLGTKSPPKANVLDYIVGLTTAVGLQLCPEECAQLLNVYCRAYICFARIEDVSKARYIPEVISDFRTSAAELVAANPNFGLSKWQSLQAVEKALKSYLSLRLPNVPRTHDLRQLAELCSNAGLLKLPERLISLVECNADVRYNSTGVKKSEAVLANHAAMDLCGLVAPFLHPRVGDQIAIRPLNYSVRGVEQQKLAVALMNLRRSRFGNRVP